MASPLKQVKAEIKPKNARLYDQFFTSDPKTPQYWHELFTITCNKQLWTELLQRTPTDAFLRPAQIQTSQTFFDKGITLLKTHGPTADQLNVLNMLEGFLEQVFAKSWPNNSTDVINILAGFTNIDKTFYQFLNSIDLIIRSKDVSLDTKRKAVETLVVTVSGAYNTSIVTYFNQRGIFSALMTYITFDESDDKYILEAFRLVGLLANVEKFESSNPYVTLLSDFVDEKPMLKIVPALGAEFVKCRDEYVPVQTSWFRTVTITDAQLATLPSKRLSILLPTLEFVQKNKLFAKTLIADKGHHTKSYDTEPPLAAFLSLCTHLFANQNKNPRAEMYSKVALIIIQLLLPEMHQSLNTKTMVKVNAKQRKPPLPLTEATTLGTGVLDALLCCLRYNMKKPLPDVYDLALVVTEATLMLYRNTPSDYHWHELWATLLNLVQFINKHADDTNNSRRDTGAILTCLAIPLASDGLNEEQKTLLIHKIVENSTALKTLVANYKSKTSSALIVMATVDHFESLIVKEHQQRSANPDIVIKNNYAEYKKSIAPFNGTFWAEIQPREFKESRERIFLKKFTKECIA